MGSKPKQKLKEGAYLEWLHRPNPHPNVWWDYAVAWQAEYGAAGSKSSPSTRRGAFKKIYRTYVLCEALIVSVLLRLNSQTTERTLGKSSSDCEQCMPLTAKERIGNAHRGWRWEGVLVVSMDGRSPNHLWDTQAWIEFHTVVDPEAWVRQSLG